MDPQQAKIFPAILVAAAILAILVGYFIVSIVRHQRGHLISQHANLLLEFNALEKERKRIVGDLHDELGPLLSVVKFQLSGLDLHHKKDLDILQRITNNLDVILQKIRSICNELMPQELHRKGLITSLREFVHELEANSHFHFDFLCEQKVRLPIDSDVHLYRLIQEIVNNSIKHSGATNIQIHLTMKNHKLVVIVADDGRGFEPAQVASVSRGFGLKSIASRVRILKGDLYLESGIGKGTRYTIELPAS